VEWRLTLTRLRPAFRRLAAFSARREPLVVMETSSA